MGLENEASDQGFCALTDLKERKTSKILQPVRSLLSYCRRIVEKRTPLRGSSDARHEGGMPESLRDTLDNRPAGGTTWCFDVSKLSQTSLQRLGRVAPGRIVPLLAEIDQMTRSNPSLETPEDMQWHAEELLHILADADGIPRCPKGIGRIGTASPCGSEKMICLPVPAVKGNLGILACPLSYRPNGSQPPGGSTHLAWL